MVHKITTQLTSPTFGFLLKLFAGLATAGFGMMGIGVETREANGQLNRKGHIALIGIIVSGILAVGTSIYEFGAGLKKEQEELKRSQRLLSSVERGLYPLRGMKVSFRLRIDPNLQGSKEFKNFILQQCRRPRTHCTKTLYGDVESAYSVPVLSRGFPEKRSIVREVLDSITLEIGFFQRPRTDNSAAIAPGSIKSLNGVNLIWREDLKKHSMLSYDSTENVLFLVVRDYPVREDQFYGTDAYSLSDLTPGVITAHADLWASGFCEDFEAASCNQQLRPVLGKVFLTQVELKFPYPTTIELFRGADSGQTVTCQLPYNDEFLLSLLPNEVKQISSTGEFEHVESYANPKQVCLDTNRRSLK